MSNRIYQTFGFGVGTQPVEIQASFENVPVFSGAIPTVTPQEYFEDVNRLQVIFTWQTPWMEQPTQEELDQNGKNSMAIHVTGGNFVLAFHNSNYSDSFDEFGSFTDDDEKKNVKINGVLQTKRDADLEVYSGSWWYLVQDGQTITYQLYAPIANKPKINPSS